MAYHWRNGLYFERWVDGFVLITSQPDPNSPASVIGEVPPAEWASIVAAVTPAGENSFTHKAAEDLHSGLTPHEADGAKAVANDEPVTWTCSRCGQVNPIMVGHEYLNECLNCHVSIVGDGV